MAAHRCGKKKITHSLLWLVLLQELLVSEDADPHNQMMIRRVCSALAPLEWRFCTLGDERKRKLDLSKFSENFLGSSISNIREAFELLFYLSLSTYGKARGKGMIVWVE